MYYNTSSTYSKSLRIARGQKPPPKPPPRPPEAPARKAAPLREAPVRKAADPKPPSFPRK